VITAFERAGNLLANKFAKQAAKRAGPPADTMRIVADLHQRECAIGRWIDEASLRSLRSCTPDSTPAPANRAAAQRALHAPPAAA
jgi:hypothetical protein